MNNYVYGFMTAYLSKQAGVMPGLDMSAMQALQRNPADTRLREQYNLQDMGDDDFQAWKQRMTSGTAQRAACRQ
jgi:hypothetical protein